MGLARQSVAYILHAYSTFKTRTSQEEPTDELGRSAGIDANLSAIEVPSAMDQEGEAVRVVVTDGFYVRAERA